MPPKKNTSTLEELIPFLRNDLPDLSEDDIQKAIDGDAVVFVAIGKKYDEKRDYEKALSWYLLGDKGSNNSQCQYQIGELFFGGKGVAQDYEQAMKWYIKAADNDGNLDAQTSIGSMYQFGIGVERDLEIAVDWFEKSANKDHTLAQYYLGDYYEREEEDIEQAVFWYTVASLNGNPYATACVKRLCK